MTEAQATKHGGGVRPGAVAIWVQAIRAPSLSASAIPVLLGGAVAARAGYFSFPRLVIALVGAIAIQAGTNLINDYYDYRSGADSSESLGPSMVIQRGLLRAGQVWWGGVVAFAIGSALGLVLVYMCGWPILALGLLSVAAGYFYTASPVALAYIALGELTVFIFMGPVIVVGTYYAIALGFSRTALWASMPIGFLVAGILHANNIRDIESDRTHRKRTLATMLGRRGANLELLALDAAAYASMIFAVATAALPWIALATLATIPRAIDQIRIVMRESEPRKLNLALLRSVQLHMEFGLLMFIAFVVAALAGW
ncbi:MAG: 1,4-dihydroxy-2-naphthoate octaprenyltransferase [Candidatus Binataceae bacterium]